MSAKLSQEDSSVSAVGMVQAAGEKGSPRATSGGSFFDCACFNARQAARAITALYDEVLEPTGLKITQFAILAAIHADADKTMQSLAADLGLDPSTMTRTLRPLLDDGLVEALAGEQDRRIKRLALTRAGRRKLGDGFGKWQQAQAQLSERLGSNVFDRLVGDLSAVNRALRE
jgi:DNA-binding MarR family transcriptional regulator